MPAPHRAPTRITTRVALVLGDRKPRDLHDIVELLGDVSERTVRVHLALLVEVGLVDCHRSSAAVYRMLPTADMHLRPTREVRAWLEHWHMLVMSDHDVPRPDAAQHWFDTMFARLDAGRRRRER